MTQFVFVVGMHRSGTSVFAGSLMELGCAAPLVMLPANLSNPKGHFEPEAATTANDAFLASLGHQWHSPRALPADAFVDAGDWADRFAGVLRQDYPHQGIAVVKDPRISLLLPLWRLAVARLGHPEPVYALVFRPPGGTVSSLLRRNAFSPEHSVALWLRYTLDAERHTRGLRRSLVPIDDFARDPVGILDRVGTDLGLTWPMKPQDRTAELAAFVERDLLRDPKAVEAPLIVLANSALAALKALSQDESDEGARAELDRIRILFNATGTAPKPSPLKAQIEDLSARIAMLQSDVASLAAEVQAQRSRPLSSLAHLIGYHVLRLVARPMPLVPALLTDRWQMLAQRRNPTRPALEGKSVRQHLASGKVADRP